MKELEIIKNNLREIISETDKLDKTKNREEIDQIIASILRLYISLRDNIGIIEKEINENIYYKYPPSILGMLDYLNGLMQKLYENIMDENKEGIKEMAFRIAGIMFEIGKNIEPMSIPIAGS